MRDASKGPVPFQGLDRTPTSEDTYPWEPPYGFVRSGTLDEHKNTHAHVHRVELAAALEDVRRARCGYSRMKHGSAASDYRTADDSRCDCKYGLGYRYLGDVSNYSTEMTGCPELRELIWHLLHGDVVELVKLREQNAALSDDNASVTDDRDDWMRRDERSREALGQYVVDGWSTDRCVAQLVSAHSEMAEQVARLKADNERLNNESNDLLATSKLKTENNTRLHMQLEQARGELLKVNGELRDARNWLQHYYRERVSVGDDNENTEWPEHVSTGVIAEGMARGRLGDRAKLTRALDKVADLEATVEQEREEASTCATERDFAIEMLDMSGDEFTEAFCSGVTAREARRRRQGQVPHGQPIEPKLTPPEQMPAKIEELRGRLFGANGDDLGIPLAEAMAEIEADEAEHALVNLRYGPDREGGPVGTAYECRCGSKGWTVAPIGLVWSDHMGQTVEASSRWLRENGPQFHAQPSEDAGGGQDTGETPWASQRPNGGPREVAMTAETVLNVRLPWGGLVHVTVGRNAEDATVETYAEHDGHGYPDTVVRVRRPA